MSAYTDELLRTVWQLAKRAASEGTVDPAVVATGPHARCDNGLTDGLPEPAEPWMVEAAVDRWGDTITLRVIAHADLLTAVAAANAGGAQIQEPMYAEQLVGAEGPSPLGLFLDVSRDYIGLAIPPSSGDWGLPRARWSVGE